MKIHINWKTSFTQSVAHTHSLHCNGAMNNGIAAFVHNQ